MRILRAADRAAVPWKNGGGVTREIAALPPGADTTGFEWRISLADVATDGPFSAFPGVDRVLTMVEGAGMALTLDGAGPRLVDTRYVPQHFPGDVPTDCRLLAGPVVNLNVMYRRGTADVHVEVVTGDLRTPAPAAGTWIAVPLDAPAAFQQQRTTPLDRYDAVVLTGAGAGAGAGIGAGPGAGAGIGAGSFGGLGRAGTLRTDGRTAVITLRHR